MKRYSLIGLLTVLVAITVWAAIIEVPEAPARMTAIIAGGGGGAAGGEQVEITDSFSSDTIANYTQDSGTWSVTGGVLSVVTDVQERIRNNTQTSTTKQWVKCHVNGVWNRKPGIILRAGGATGVYYVLRFTVDSAVVDWVQMNGATEVATVESSSALTFVETGGDDIGVSVEGEGDSTVIRVWKDPSGDSPTAWGSAGITFTANPANPADTGKYVGLFNQGTSATATTFDNLTAGVW